MKIISFFMLIFPVYFSVPLFASNFYDELSSNSWLKRIGLSEVDLPEIIEALKSNPERIASFWIHIAIRGDNSNTGKFLAASVEPLDKRQKQFLVDILQNNLTPSGDSNVAIEEKVSFKITLEDKSSLLISVGGFGKTPPGEVQFYLRPPGEYRFDSITNSRVWYPLDTNKKTIERHVQVGAGNKNFVAQILSIMKALKPDEDAWKRYPQITANSLFKQ